MSNWTDENYPLVTPKLTDRLLNRRADTDVVTSCLVSAVANAASVTGAVASIAALKAIPSDGQKNGLGTIVAGYSSVGDGGGGLFYYNAVSTTPDNGGTIIAPDDGVGRYFRSQTNDYLNVKWFGAVGDGVEDDTVAILASIAVASAVGPRRVYAPRGTYLVGSSIAITASVFIFGDGAESIAYNGYSASTGTTFKWTGTGATFVRFTGLNDGGGGMSDIRLLCESIATEAIVIDGCTGMTLRNVTAIDFLTDGMVLTAGSDRTCSWNSFDQIHLQSDADGHSCIWLTGTPPNGNTCHNMFGVMKLIHGGTMNGIVLGYCDNNQFNSTFILRGSGSGYGVLVVNTESADFPVANIFVLLEAGSGGWFQPSTVASMPALIFGYQMDNGQPLPNVSGVNKLLNFTSYGTEAGVTEFGASNGVAGNFGFSGTYPSGATSHTFNLPQTEPDTKYRIDLTPYGNLGSWWISNKTTTTFTVDLAVAAPSDIVIDCNLTRTD